ncbi:MAG: FKBP-type peptidyl-prolyl cis-trans isomerase [Bacteroidia bacterium]|nr:FKBP-type peptidyl-prolyl cis-trans isomerase [Bacteroidia bacterium]
MTRLLWAICVLLCFSACKKKETVNQKEEDENKITQYIADNKLEATATGTGLYYVVKTQGTGAKPSSTSTVRVIYKGYLTDGTVFDQSGANGYTTNLQDVIKGWTEGIPYFKKGGKGILLIPSALGYGNQAVGDIPANSVLIFDIELAEVY